MADEFQRILIVRLNDIGEVVMSTAAIAAARLMCPNAFITVITAPPNDDLLRKNPDIDCLLSLNKSTWRQGQRGRFIRELYPLLHTLRKHQFDLALDLQNVPSTHWLIRASGAKRRVGFKTLDFSCRLHTDWVPVQMEKDAIHQVDRFRSILAHALGDLPETRPQLSVDPDIQYRFDTQHPVEEGYTVILQPGAGLPERCWPVEYFAKLAAWLCTGKHCSVWIHAGPGEEPLAYTIREIAPQTKILSGLSLQELAAALKRCDLLVTNDSGPMHMAAALDVPLVAIFGSTDPRVSGPYRNTANTVTVTRNMRCSPCGRYKFECPHRECLTKLPFEDVRRAVEEVLDL